MGEKRNKRVALRKILFSFLVAILLVWLMIPGVQGQQKIYDDLFSACFVNEKEGWASGRWGCILYTGGWGQDLGAAEEPRSFLSHEGSC